MPPLSLQLPLLALSLKVARGFGNPRQPLGAPITGEGVPLSLAFTLDHLVVVLLRRAAPRPLITALHPGTSSTRLLVRTTPCAATRHADTLLVAVPLLLVAMNVAVLPLALWPWLFILKAC